ncbi:MAG: ATP-binding cassette domain-containing protein [bacterium]|nr:ATP-binding cassette domain-containing protein [bacterium]
MNATDLHLPHLGQPFLTLKSVTKSYGQKIAANQVSLTIPRGTIYGFLGPNGSGKTTTIRSIMNIILPDSGKIELAGHPMDGSLRDRIGYLPEERGLYRKMKCRDQLAYLAELKGVPRKEALARADVWLQRMGLSDYRNEKIDTLSKGMQQKIQFAATFISEPDLVILDEVFTGLDPINIELLREMILEEKEKGTTILFSTHMLAEAEKICDHICLISNGKIIIDGTLTAVREDFPLKSVRVAWSDDTEPEENIKGVLQREYHEGSWRLTLDEGVDPKSLLPALSQAGPLTLFSANRPSLGEIFLEAVDRHQKGGQA